MKQRAFFIIFIAANKTFKLLKLNSHSYILYSFLCFHVLSSQFWLNLIKYFLLVFINYVNDELAFDKSARLKSLKR